MQPNRRRDGPEAKSVFFVWKRSVKQRGLNLLGLTFSGEGHPMIVF